MNAFSRVLCRILFTGLLAAVGIRDLRAQSRVLRVVAYNIEADITLTNRQATFTNIVTSATEGAPLPGLIAPATNAAAVQLGGVLEGIGEEVVSGHAQPLDILALEETTSNSETVAPIVNGLNAFYSVAGMYSNSSYQATESDGSPAFGNGPNALVFNTLTLQLLASTPIDPTGGTSKLGGVSSGDSGEYREVMLYQFAPAGVAANASNVFYVYVSHYKSGGSSPTNNPESRAGEASIVRSDMTASLPATARVLHVGDFNTGNASEQMYGILTAPGANQLIDPLNSEGSLTTNFDNSAAPGILTDSDTELTYRDDYQMMTTNVDFGTPGGLALVPGTYHAFGNNGTISYRGTVNSMTNNALSGRLITNGPVFISDEQLYVDLTGASDHLPIVADYAVPMPAPVLTQMSVIKSNLVFSVSGGITNAVYFLLMSTNIFLPPASWTQVASNRAPAAEFTIIGANLFNPSAPRRFFLLQTR